MRDKPADEVFRAWLTTKGIFNNAPNVDGWVLPAVTARRFEEGKHQHVPLLVGFNRDEWTSLRRYWPNVTVDGFQQVLRAVYGTIADRAIALYPATTDAEAVTAADRWQTDWYYACPSRFISHRMTRAGDEVYFYLFSRTVPGPGGDQLGAYHAAEIPYVWDTLKSETWVAREPWDQKLADAMSAAWVRFATTGNPNGGDLPRWPAYNREEGQYLEFGNEIRVGSGIRKEYCETYEDLQAFRLANSPQ
jgi:para-nitrobenzyl esterase